MGIFFSAPIDQWPAYDPVLTVPSVSSESASFPGANLLTYDPTRPYISLVTNPVITWDFGSTRSFDIVSLLWTNLTEVATLLIEGSLNGSSWTTIYNSTALAHVIAGQTVQNKRMMLVRNNTLNFTTGTPWSYRYLRLTINSQNTSILPSIGRLFVGSRFVPSTGWQYGSAIEFLDLSKRDRTDQGALVLLPQRPVPIANVKMDFLNKTEMMDCIWEFNYWRGMAREILACLDVDDIKYLQKNLIYGTISEGRRISFDSYNTHSATWVIESIA